MGRWTLQPEVDFHHLHTPSPALDGTSSGQCSSSGRLPSAMGRCQLVWRRSESRQDGASTRDVHHEHARDACGIVRIPRRSARLRSGVAAGTAARRRRLELRVDTFGLRATARSTRRSASSIHSWPTRLPGAPWRSTPRRVQAAHSSSTTRSIGHTARGWWSMTPSRGFRFRRNGTSMCFGGSSTFAAVARRVMPHCATLSVWCGRSDGPMGGGQFIGHIRVAIGSSSKRPGPVDGRRCVPCACSTGGTAAQPRSLLESHSANSLRLTSTCAARGEARR